jgi:hypothetical protein
MQFETGAPLDGRHVYANKINETPARNTGLGPRTLEFAVGKTSYFDLTRRRRPEVQRLADLKKGEKMIHDHDGYRTPMNAWIAQQRPRLKRDFEVSPIAPGNGQEPKQFQIWWTRKWRKGQKKKASRMLSLQAKARLGANDASDAGLDLLSKRRQAVRA